MSSGWRRGARVLGTWAVLLPAAVAAADLPDVKRRRTLRAVVVGSPDDPAVTPSRFLARQAGVVTGLEGEMLLGFARLHGVELELVFVQTWDTLLPSLLAGKADLIGGGFSDTPERRRAVAFTVETFPSRNVVVTHRSHRAVETLAQLREERIGVTRGSSYAETARVAGVLPGQLDDSLGAPRMSTRDALRQGRVTAIIEGVEIALMGDLEEFQVGMFLGPRESLAFAVRKEDVHLRAALDDYVGNVRKTPTWNRLVVKYFGERALEVLRRVRDP